MEHPDTILEAISAALQEAYDYVAANPRYTSVVLGILSVFPTLPVKIIRSFPVMLRIMGFLFLGRSPVKLPSLRNNLNPGKISDQFQSLIKRRADGAPFYSSIVHSRNPLDLHIGDDRGSEGGIKCLDSSVFVDVVVTLIRLGAFFMSIIIFVRSFQQ